MYQWSILIIPMVMRKNLIRTLGVVVNTFGQKKETLSDGGLIVGDDIVSNYGRGREFL